MKVCQWDALLEDEGAWRRCTGSSTGAAPITARGGGGGCSPDCRRGAADEGHCRSDGVAAHSPPALLARPFEEEEAVGEEVGHAVRETGLGGVLPQLDDAGYKARGQLLYTGSPFSAFAVNAFSVGGFAFKRPRDFVSFSHPLKLFCILLPYHQILLLSY